MWLAAVQCARDQLICGAWVIAGWRRGLSYAKRISGSRLTTALTFGVSVAVLVPPHSDPASSLPPQDPMEIYVDDSKLTLHGLQQHYVKLAENEKNRKLNELLDALEFNQVVIFVKSVQRAIQLDKLLQECNFPSVAIHARIEQAERIELYQSFKDFKHRILVSTDIWGAPPPPSPRTPRLCPSPLPTSLLHDATRGPDSPTRSRLAHLPRSWHRHRACQHCHQLRHARGVGHLLAPRWPCRPLRHQGPRHHLRLQRRGRQDPRGRAVAFRGVHHAAARVDRRQLLHDGLGPARLSDEGK